MATAVPIIGRTTVTTVNTWGYTNAPAPSTKKSLRRLVTKFQEHGTVQDRRKRRPSSREGVEEVATPDTIEEVYLVKAAKFVIFYS